MENEGDTAYSHDDGSLYDNDYEKLSHDEEVSSTTAISSGSSLSEPVASHRTEEAMTTPVKPQPMAGQPAAQHGGTGDEKPSCASCCQLMKKLDPRVVELVMWRDVKKTGIVFASSLIIFISLALCSVVSVLSYLSLALLTATSCFRIYHHLLSTVKKSDAPNPFRQYLDMDLTVADETARQYADFVAKNLTRLAEELRRLFFVENVIDTLKFALILWMLTYIGGWFNGMTLIILGDILVFAVPKIYEMYQKQIDDVIALVHAKVGDVWKRLEQTIPVLSKLKQS